MAARRRAAVILGDSRQAHAFDDALALGKVRGVVAFGGGAKSTDGKVWRDRQARLCFATRLVDPPQMGETRSEIEVGEQIVVVDIDRFSEPGCRVREFAETLRPADMIEPIVGGSISGAQSQGFQHVSLGFSRPVDVCVDSADVSACRCGISG